MSREHVEGAIAVEDRGKSAELGLVGRGLRNPTTREAIDQERGHSELAEVFRPELLTRAYASRAMQQDDGGQSTCRIPGEAQLARNCDPLSILVASQELLIAQSNRLYCVYLGARRESARARLGQGRLRSDRAENDADRAQDTHVVLPRTAAARVRSRG